MLALHWQRSDELSRHAPCTQSDEFTRPAIVVPAADVCSNFTDPGINMQKSLFVVLIGLLASSALAQDTPKHPDQLGPDEHTRTLLIGEQKRT
jgi:hypothetical protein